MEITWETCNAGGPFLLVVLLAVAVGAVFYLSNQNHLASSLARRQQELLISSLETKGPERVEAPVKPRAEGSRKTRIITGPAEKRKSLRREGNPIPILLTFSGNPSEAVPGVVLDRSTGGLGVSAPHDAEVGMLVLVRPVDAPEEVPWFTLEVRHTHPKGSQWFLGLKFENKLPWSQLLYFG